MATTSTWGWWAPGASSESGANPGNDIRSNFDGFIFGIGGNTSTHGFGQMAMIDGDDDNQLEAVQVNSTSAPGNGDRFQTPDGIDRQIFEISIFDDSIYTYTDSDGISQTYTAPAIIYQLGNGDLVVRMRDADRNGAPDDLFIDRVTSITLGSWDGTRYGATIVSNFDEPPPNVCFTRGTLIATDRENFAVEKLCVDDLVATRDAGLQPIRWIGSRKLSTSTLDAHPDLKPVRIRSGALGNDTPKQDLVVSPQHRILVQSNIA